jgi:hypothetical protein
MSLRLTRAGTLFSGTINGVKLDMVMVIQPMSKGKYIFAARATNANLAGTANPVNVGLTIGNDAGSASITAFFE